MVCVPYFGIWLSFLVKYVEWQYYSVPGHCVDPLVEIIS